jgi:predicted nucleic acid-binding protein
MILVDTSVWIDHLRKPENLLQNLLQREMVLCHPMVIGEIAVGSLRQRDVILNDLRDLPMLIAAGHEEVLQFISHQSLYGLGIGYIDAHLLASVRLTPEASLWTRDKRLHGIAENLKLAFHPDS